MRLSLAILVFQIFSFTLQAQGGMTCQYWGKDYDSPGFGIPYRSGFHIKARFGCRYECKCPDGKATRLTHVLEEKHIDLNVFSEKTGGARMAKNFLCPQSVDDSTWRPIRDELGNIIAYHVEPNVKPFPAERLASLPVIQEWSKTCQ